MKRPGNDFHHRIEIQTIKAKINNALKENDNNNNPAT